MIQYENIFLSSKTFAVLRASSASGFRNLAVERTYSYPKFPALCGRRVESKTADTDHRRSGVEAHLRPQGMAVTIKNAGNERIFTTKGFGCKNTENDGFSL